LASSTPQARQRRTQEERSASTRTRLLDATIECLIDLGYARTTTTEVAERAGLSRGAQLHHFPTKADLVIEAVAHLASRRAEEMRAERDGLALADNRVEAVLDLIWSSFSGPLFYAAMELWIAARTDPDLHKILYRFERGVGRAMLQLGEELVTEGQDGASPWLDDLLELSFYVMRGMALQRILRDDDTERSRLFEVWKRLVAAALSQPAILNSGGFGPLKQRNN
jgi:AcrR family transcriptional regulator